MPCNGKCQLTKKMKQVDRTIKNNNLADSVFQPFYQNFSIFDFVMQGCKNKIIRLRYHLLHRQASFILNIFQFFLFTRAAWFLCLVFSNFDNKIFANKIKALSNLFRVFVIGASAGGHDAVINTLANIPINVNGAFLVVIHNSFDSSGGFERVLEKKIKLKVQLAGSEVPILPGNVYLSFSNQHLVVSDSSLMLSKGPRENLFRPSIDVLFRSAAVSFKNRCVGVLLTGRLNDGTAGLLAIKRCGGIAIIQDPKTAEFSEMPLSAQRSVKVDYCMDVEDIGKLIEVICQQPLPPEKEVPQSLVKEARIALAIKSEISKEDSLGEQVPFSCPSCGGPLWKMTDESMERYRCHVGHAFSQEAMLSGQNRKLEETLWVALRTFEEKRILLQRMAETYSEKGFTTLSASFRNKVEEVTEHINRLRDVMKLND